MSAPLFRKRSDVPWAFVRELWEQGKTCYAIADLFKIPPTTVFDRAKREGWPRLVKRTKRANGTLLPRAQRDLDGFTKDQFEILVKRAFRHLKALPDKQLINHMAEIRSLHDVCARTFGWNAVQSTRANGSRKSGRTRSSRSPDYTHEDDSLDSETGHTP